LLVILEEYDSVGW